MNVTECLDELQAALLRDASTQISGDIDNFWPRPRLLLYLNEAQRRFARRSLCIHDDTTPQVVQVVLVTGQPLYVLHKSVLRVMSARHQDATQDMVRMTHPNTYARLNIYTDHVNGNETTGFNANQVVHGDGMPGEFSTDEGTKINKDYQIRMLVRATPSAAQAGKIINLRTVRLPLNKLAEKESADAITTLEVPEDYALDVLEWAAFRAWRTYDAQDDNGREWASKKAKDHALRFEEAVRECRKEMEMKMYQPMKWGFGQGAFANYVKN